MTKGGVIVGGVFVASLIGFVVAFLLGTRSVGCSGEEFFVRAKQRLQESQR
jgi:hypothetical protein